MMLNRDAMVAIHTGYQSDLNAKRMNQTDFDRLWPWMVAVKVAQWIRQSGGNVVASNVADFGCV